MLKNLNVRFVVVDGVHHRNGQRFNLVGGYHANTTIRLKVILYPAYTYHHMCYIGRIKSRRPVRQEELHGCLFDLNNMNHKTRSI